MYKYTYNLVTHTSNYDVSIFDEKPLQKQYNIHLNLFSLNPQV